MEQAVRSHLERYGGVVLQRMIDTLKASHPDAPELESEEAFKQYFEGKDEFRITTSVNNVERIRLTNAHRPSQGLFRMVISSLEDLVRSPDQLACVCLARRCTCSSRSVPPLAQGEGVLLPPLPLCRTRCTSAERDRRRRRGVDRHAL